MHDWASPGVRKLKELLSAAGDSARRWDKNACGFIVGVSASMEEAKAARMKWLYGDALMVLLVVCRCGSGVLTGVVQRWAGRGLVIPLLFFFVFQLCGGKFCLFYVINPATKVQLWQWEMVTAVTAMEGGGGKANSNGRETGACVVVDC
jgi:hypothetical protein